MSWTSSVTFYYIFFSLKFSCFWPSKPHGTGTFGLQASIKWTRFQGLQFPDDPLGWKIMGLLHASFDVLNVSSPTSQAFFRRNGAETWGCLEGNQNWHTQPGLVPPARPCPLFDDSVKVSQGSHSSVSIFDSPPGKITYLCVIAMHACRHHKTFMWQKFYQRALATPVLSHPLEPLLGSNNWLSFMRKRN